eukprot:175267_1
MSLLEVLPINSLIKYKCRYGWKNGLIISSDKNKFIIDLEISNETYTTIHIEYKTAMKCYYVLQTLKLLSKVNNIPSSLFKIGTNIEFKYKNTRWKNGKITNVSNQNYLDTSIQIKFKITINDYQTMTMNISKIVIDYHLNKTLKLSNMIYPNWIQLDSIVQINGINHKVICYKDGKSITFRKISNNSYQRLFTLWHFELTKITHYYICTTNDIICKKIKYISTSYTWKIPSLSDANIYTLCNGYVNIYSHRYITTAIIQIIAQFFNNRDGKVILNKIKNGSHNEPFYTQIVSIQSFKWQLQIDRYFDVNVCLVSLPNYIRKLSVYLRLTLRKTDVKFINNIHNFYQNKLITSNVVSLYNINHLKRLRFKLDMVVIDIQHTNDVLKSKRQFSCYKHQNNAHNKKSSVECEYQISCAQQENMTNIMYFLIVLCVVSVLVIVKFYV